MSLWAEEVAMAQLRSSHDHGVQKDSAERVGVRFDSLSSRSS